MKHPAPTPLSLSLSLPFLPLKILVLYMNVGVFNLKRTLAEKIARKRNRRPRNVVLANTLGSWSRWASSLLTDRLQYWDAAKASGEIRARTI